MTAKRVVFVKPEHVEPGKVRYIAERCLHINNLFRHAQINNEAYRFIDGRILVVDLQHGHGFLYESEDTFFEMYTL